MPELYYIMLVVLVSKVRCMLVTYYIIAVELYKPSFMHFNMRGQSFLPGVRLWGLRLGQSLHKT